MQERRRVIILEVDNQAIEYVNLIIEFIKEKNLLIPIWEPWTHPTKLVTYESPRGDINRFVGFSQDHTNYHCSLTAGELAKTMGLEASIPINRIQGE